jgi:hypothetical protein
VLVKVDHKLTILKPQQPNDAWISLYMMLIMVEEGWMYAYFYFGCIMIGHVDEIFP